MFVIGQQELFQFACRLLYTLLFKNRGPLLGRSDILHILFGTSEC